MNTTTKNNPSDNVPSNVSKAYQYYLKGLTAKETGKLLDVSARTVQRWIGEYEFKKNANPLTLQEKAYDMQKKGFSYSQIARTLKKSKTTIYYYLKAVKSKNA